MSAHGRVAIETAVLGGGIIGRTIALALAQAGHRVVIVEPAEVTALALPALLESILGSDPGALARITISAELGPSVAGAALVIEAIPEVIELKASIWRQLGQFALEEAVLSSNTSALDIDALAALVPHPSRVLGMHWFNPAHEVECVEIVRASVTSTETIEWAVALLTAAGKQPVVVRNSPGFVANRIQFALMHEALLCLEEGLASADEIDRIVSTSFGVRLAVLGPLANADLGGLDTYRSILRFLSSTLGERFEVPELLNRLVDDGRLGTKSGAGINDYSEQSATELASYRDRTLRRVISVVREERSAR